MKKIFSLIAVIMLLCVQNAGAWGYKNASDGWASVNTAYQLQSSFYNNIGVNETNQWYALIVTNPGSGFNVTQYNDGNGQTLYVGLNGAAATSANTIVRAVAKYDNGLYSNFTVVIPEGNIWVTPAGGMPILMTDKGNYQYEAIIPRVASVSITGDNVTTTAIQAQDDMPAGGLPASVQLNIADVAVTATENFIRVKYNLWWNQVIVEDANLAFNKLVTVRDTWIGDGGVWVAAGATDGNTTTAWMSDVDGNSVGSWLYVDLGTQYVLNKIKIHWFGNRWPNNAWKLQVATTQPDTNGDADWTDVYVGSAATNPTTPDSKTTYEISLTAGQYVRFLGESQAMSYGFHIREFEVYGLGEYDATAGTDLSDVLIAPASPSVYLRDELQFTATALQADLLPYAGAIYTWSVAPNATASISTSGLFSANAIGTYTVTCQASDGVNPAVSSAVTVTVNDLPAFDPSENLALNKPSSASIAELPAPNANDGNIGTRWAAGNLGGGLSDNWWQVDLGRNYVVTQVKISWEGAYASEFKIQTRLSETDEWTDVANFTDYNPNTAGELSPNFQTINLATPQPARYVRFQGIRVGNWGYSFWEFQVYGTGYFDPSAGDTFTSVVVTPTGQTNYVGDELQFSAIALAESGAVLSDATFDWDVSPAGGASINAAGLFVATEVGTYTVTATGTIEGITISGAVTVAVNAARVPQTIEFLRNIDDITDADNNRVHYTSDIYLVNEVAQYRVIVKDQYNSLVNDATISYTVTSGDESNITFGETAEAKTVSFSAEGDYEISATATKGTTSINSGALTFKVVSFPEISKDEWSVEAVSTEQEENSGARTFDGNRLGGASWSSSFASGASSNEYIIINLDAPYTLDMIEVSFERASAKVYTIEAAETADGTYDVLGGENSTSPAEFNYHIYRSLVSSTAQYQYLKINCTQATSNWGNQIYEISAWGAPVVPPVFNTQVDAENTLTVYPSPAEQTLHISGNNAYGNITVRDLSGRIVLQQWAKSELNVSTLNSGVYFISANNQTAKFIKK